MHHKIGLKLYSTNIDSYLKDAKKLYSDGYFDYIELTVVPNSLETVEKWKKIDIPFILHNAHFALGFDLSNKRKKDFNKDIYRQTKIFADKLNVEFIIFHGGIGGDIEETIYQLNSFNEPRALIENKPFIVENKLFAGLNCIGATYEEIDYIMQSTSCGFCLDFGHATCAANALNVDADSFINKLNSLNPAMYHLTDLKDIGSPYDSHEHLGKGQMNIKKNLEKVANEKCVTFETKKDFKNSLEDFKKDIQYLRKITKRTI